MSRVTFTTSSSPNIDKNALIFIQLSVNLKVKFCQSDHMAIFVQINKPLIDAEREVRGQEI
jgi:hypothetical protein